jgi:hypothetical protein
MATYISRSLRVRHLIPRYRAFSATVSLKRDGASHEPPPTDFSQMDVLGNTPVPSTSVDMCLPDGFRLNNGIHVKGGTGVLLVGGEAFAWRPWSVSNRLVNDKGQWEADAAAFGVLSMVWPRPGRSTVRRSQPTIRHLITCNHQISSSWAWVLPHDR